MKLTNTKIILFSFIVLSFLLILNSCGGGDDSSPPPNPNPVIDNPESAILIFPENNKECYEGTIINDSESKVTFEWNESENTDNYEINIKNLNTNIVSKTTVNINEAEITINRGTPYQWFVVSKANGNTTTANSDIWKFYNAGLGDLNHVPFPADLIAPLRGSEVETTNIVNLEWNTVDLDNDIVNYEVFIGTVNPPDTSLGITSQTTIQASVSATNNYYWMVKTTDNAENTSESEVFEFRVK